MGQPILVLAAAARWGSRSFVIISIQTKSRMAAPGAVFLSSPSNTVGEWLSLVEHLVRDQGVGGSNPLSPTNYPKHFHWITLVPEFGISTIWVRLGPFNNSSIFSTTFLAFA